MRDMGIQNIVTGFALDALAIGVIVTDREGRMIFANAAADRLLDKKTGALRSCSGRIRATSLEAQTKLQAIIARACLGQKIVQLGSNYLLAPSKVPTGPDLAICVLTFEAQQPHGANNAMMLVRVIERDCNMEMEARRLFGLTRTEAKFASSLASGLSLLEAAKTHDVSPATARSHMKNIFRKTGVSRQSQVAALLRGAQIPVWQAEQAPHLTLRAG